MRTFRQNLWIACLVLLPAAIGSIAVTGAAFQVPPTKQAQAQQAEERRKALEKILQDLGKGTPPPQTQGQPPPAAAPAASPVSPIVQRPSLTSGGVLLKYDNLPLYDFITQLADMLKITPIMIDPDVKGSAYIYSSAAMPEQDVFPIFMAVLKNNNAALVKSKTGNFYKIVPISQGLKEGLEVVNILPPPPPPKPDQEKKEPQKTEGAAAGQVKPPTPPGTATPPATPPGAAAPPNPAIAAPADSNTRQAQAAAAASAAASNVPRLATHIVRVEFVPVQSLIEPLKLFMTDGGVIMPYERQNMLIITDYSDSLQKILEIIQLLDNSFLDADLIELIEIKNNVASDLLEDLKKIFGGGKDASTGVSLTSLDRINAIMVMANSKRALEEVRRWIARLDTTAGRSVQTFIYPVQNGTASNIAMVLSMLFGSGDAGTGTSSIQQGGQGGGLYGGPGSGGTGSTGRTTNTGLGGGGAGLGNTQGGSRLSNSGVGGNLNQQGLGGMGSVYPGGAGVFGGQQQIGGPRLGQNTGMTAQVLNASQFSGLQGQVRIVADDINNALIVQGSAADYAYLLETIKRMDILPRQVIIDARIFEIDLTDALSFGVSATLQARTAGDHLTTGSIAADTGALSAQSFAFVGASREILMNLSALRQKTKVRILEAPSILAIDGQTAHIQIGGSVPVPGMSYVAPAGGATTGVNYIETGTTLEIMPRISASGIVTLQIAQAVTAPGAQTALGPTFSTTNISTTLAVKDGESVAIAGLIRESDTSARNGIPILSDIPVLGALFGRTTRNSMRTELLIMITPHVIRTPDRFREMTEELKDSLRNVGKYLDEKQKRILDDQQQARKDKEEAIKKQDKKSDPPAAVKKVEPPAAVKKDDPPVVKKRN